MLIIEEEVIFLTPYMHMVNLKNKYFIFNYLLTFIVFFHYHLVPLCPFLPAITTLLSLSMSPFPFCPIPLPLTSSSLSCHPALHL